jgi:hypothetical protein
MSQKESDSLPPISKALVKALEERCPEKCPELSMSEKEIWFYAGQRQIVRLIKKAYEDQNENILIKE